MVISDCVCWAMPVANAGRQLVHHVCRVGGNHNASRGAASMIQVCWLTTIRLFALVSRCCWMQLMTSPWSRRLPTETRRLRRYKQYGPDVVHGSRCRRWMELSRPRAQFARRIRNARIVVLTSFSDRSRVTAALDAGACG